MSIRLQKLRPFPQSVSIGSVNITAGTAGCLVRRKSDGKLCVLSNYHVVRDGDDVIQQGRIDGGAVPRVGVSVGVQIPASGGKIDAGIVVLDDDNLVRSEILEIGVPKGINTEPQLNMKVKKSGRTTGYQEGVIMDTHAVLQIDYGSEGIKTLEDLLLYSPNMSQGGDSGSTVLDDSNRVVGLNFAGSSEYAIGCKIQNVLDALNITVVTEAIGKKYKAIEIVLPYQMIPSPLPSPSEGIPYLTASLDKGTYESEEKMKITGSLKDAETGAGLADRTIQARSLDFVSNPWQAKTDVDGNFTISLIPLKPVQESLSFNVTVSFAGDP